VVAGAEPVNSTAEMRSPASRGWLDCQQAARAAGARAAAWAAGDQHPAKL